MQTMKRKLIAAVILILVFCFPCAALASVTLNLSAESAAVGSTINYSGTAVPGVLVPVKVLDGAGNIVFYDEVLADATGAYSGKFVTPDAPQPLKIIAGYGGNVAAETLNVTLTKPPGQVRGGSSTSKTNSNTWSITSALGGTTKLGDVSLKIPPNALQGSDRAQVTIQKLVSAPSAPAGLMIMGAVYQFTVNGQEHYSFNVPVTIAFTFDPSKLAPGQNPAVYYYDENKGQWLRLGGTVSGHTITVTVDHFTKFAVMAEKNSVPEPKPGVNLTDIAGHWAGANIKKLVELGAVSGYPDGSFKPNKTITRAEFATVLVNAFNLTPRQGKKFTDTANHWARDFISTAAAYGIVNGYDDSRFGPNDPITREQIAAMIVKAAKLSPAFGELTFTDSGDISTWAKESIITAVKNGIIKGYPGNILKPKGDASRAEAVTIIVNSMIK
ncbi:MAG: hypothetical protein VR67_14875 [Peptococcaceae bacterium BRH_c8a]|nr:MAG: hypothetical protein VR67_14875 [Peptococcaceae bacterium BRH_c8a]